VRKWRLPAVWSATCERALVRAWFGMVLLSVWPGLTWLTDSLPGSTLVCTGDCPLRARGRGAADCQLRQDRDQGVCVKGCVCVRVWWWEGGSTCQVEAHRNYNLGCQEAAWARATDSQLGPWFSSGQPLTPEMQFRTPLDGPFLCLEQTKCLSPPANSASGHQARVGWTSIRSL